VTQAEPSPKRGLSRVLRALGPGVTTGAADDDPSGIATYSVGCVQVMCARIGMVTGMGLAGAAGSQGHQGAMTQIGI
jgi:Mn2+/Fe2+ NRAMP family transporter